MIDLDRTIAAVATAPGRGGVSCIRLSGPRAHEIACARFDGSAPTPGGRPVFGHFLDAEGASVDHGFLVLFAAGKSYTGEATAELWIHGSPPVQRELLLGLVAAGAELAGPGEFTYRAVRRGRLDLARAEAVRDLIDARTGYQARLALERVEGALARRIRPWVDTIEEWMARNEAAIEFAEDEAETELARSTLQHAVRALLKQATRLRVDFERGRRVREGARLALVGPPNVGKSSLFNRLLAEDRAIVSDVPGTTRDTLEEEVDLDGLPLRLVDTAGQRRSQDPIESEGMRRAQEAERGADIVIRLFAAPEVEGALPIDDDPRTLVVVNKIDLESGSASERGRFGSALCVSAETGEGLEELRLRLRDRLLGQTPVEAATITNARQAEALDRALAALGQAREVLDRPVGVAGGGGGEELVAEELKIARDALGDIVGEFGNEELYDRLFSTFCIGK